MSKPTLAKQDRIANQLGALMAYAAEQLDHDAAPVAIQALGLAQDWTKAGKNAVEHLRAMRRHVQSGGLR